MTETENRSTVKSEDAQYWLGAGSMVGGRYRLEKVLGRGGYGITYRGVDTRLEQLVAVKEYFPVFCASRYVARQGAEVHCIYGNEDAYENGIERFLDEARRLAKVNQISGIVRVIDFFEENNTAYLVMEYLDGKNLKQMTNGFGGRIPADILLPAISGVIDTLGAIHRQELIHRDLSPDNIMMLSDGTMRLIDFGNARDVSSNKSLTLAMKEGFAAPEQYRSHGQGTWTDVYGLCATIYYCLTGKLPPQAFDRLMGAPFPKPSALGVKIAPQAEDALMDGMELYVQKRIQTMDELAQRLYAAPQQESAAGQPPAAEGEEKPLAAKAEEKPATCKAGAEAFTFKAEEVPKTLKLEPQTQSQDVRLWAAEQMQHIRDICAAIFSRIKER